MFFIDILVALAIAVLLTALFVAVFRTTGPWAGFWIFLLVVFLASWAGGVWLTPFGPPIFGITWLPFLITGLFFALLLAAATPVYPARKTTTPETAAEAETAAAFSIFFWVLIAGLGLFILLAYFI